MCSSSLEWLRSQGVPSPVATFRQKIEQELKTELCMERLCKRVCIFTGLELVEV
jgi:hypothetical protein